MAFLGCSVTDVPKVDGPGGGKKKRHRHPWQFLDCAEMFHYIGDDVCDNGLVEGEEEDAGEDCGYWYGCQCTWIFTIGVRNASRTSQSPSPSSYGTWRVCSRPSCFGCLAGRGLDVRVR